MRLAFLAAIAAGLALAGSASAQDPENALDALMPGRRSFAFSAHALENGGQAGIGFWRVVTPDRARGLLLNVSSQVTHFGSENGFTPASDAQVSVTLGPRTRRYVRTATALLPFLESGLDLGVGYSLREGGGSPSSMHTWSPTLGATAGGGAQWFPLRRLSLAGQAGLRASVSYLHSSQSGGVTSSSSNGWGASVTTFISALTLQIYF